MYIRGNKFDICIECGEGYSLLVSLGSIALIAMRGLLSWTYGTVI